MDPRIAELEAKRAARLEALAAEETSQHIRDLEAREELEDVHGPTAAVKVSKFVKGFPTRAFVKTPTSAQYKRYLAQVGKAVEKKNTAAQREAHDLLALSCWVYPIEQKDREAMLEAFPGLLTTLGAAATVLAEGRQEEEGKG